MAIEVVELIHAGIRIAPDEGAVAAAREVYAGVLGLEIDASRPDIPGVPGLWINLQPGSNRSQVHMIGVEGVSPVARTPKEDLAEAEAELKRRGIDHWVFEGVVGARQVFLEDGCGNMIELQQHRA